MVAVIECCRIFACRWRLVEERIQGRLLDSGVEVLSIKIDGAERTATTRIQTRLERAANNFSRRVLCPFFLWPGGM